jgi:hypothetical protein
MLNLAELTSPEVALPELVNHVEPQLTRVQREIALAAKYGIDLSFLEEAWMVELATVYFQMFPTAERVRKEPSPYNRRLELHHNRQTTIKPRHGSRRGVRTTRRHN